MGDEFDEMRYHVFFYSKERAPSTFRRGKIFPTLTLFADDTLNIKHQNTHVISHVWS